MFDCFNTSCPAYVCGEDGQHGIYEGQLRREPTIMSEWSFEVSHGCSSTGDAIRKISAPHLELLDLVSHPCHCRLVERWYEWKGGNHWDR